MDIGIFQLLPRPASRSDREVIAQGLREADFAEQHGFDSVWVTEHHLSDFGLIGAPSVYATAVAARTRRIRIGYGVAVVPLHHPLRLAEEIAWLQELSGGRVLVGVGPGFSPFEFGAFGVPLEERHARLEEGLAILKLALSGEEFSYDGKFWQIPPVTLRPRMSSLPPLLRTSSADRSLRNETDCYLLRRIVIAPTDEQAFDAFRATGTDDEKALCGSPATVIRQLRELDSLGYQRLIGWFHFGDLPYDVVMRSMELMAVEVMPELRDPRLVVGS